MSVVTPHIDFSSGFFCKCFQKVRVRLVESYGKQYLSHAEVGNLNVTVWRLRKVSSVGGQFEPRRRI